MHHIRHQPVRDVDCAARNANQRATQRDTWCGCMQTRGGARKYIGGQRDRTLQVSQRQRRTTQIAGYPNIVAVLGGVPSYRLTHANFAQRGNRDRQRPAGGIAADQLHTMLVGQRKKTTRKRRKPVFINRWQGQGECDVARLCAHRGKV